MPEALPDEIKYPNEYGVSGGTVAILVVVVIFINIVVMYCHRRHSKRELQSEMNVKIESAVNQYFALSQVSNKPYLK